MIQRWLNQTNLPLLEKSAKFTAARGQVLADDIVNLSTPGYVAKDLSPEKFQQLLRRQAESGPRPADGDDEADKALAPENANDNVLFHDRTNGSVEQLMADQAANAMMHNLMTELMRKQFAQIQMALKERVT